MATFNTAFGALQTPQDVANRSMSGGIPVNRMMNQQAQPASGGIQINRFLTREMPSIPGQQQLQAQAASQKSGQPMQQQTFAQMQQAGQARPAPMPAPVSIGIPMRQQPVLLGKLQSQLNPPSTGAIQQQRQQLMQQQEGQAFGQERQRLIQSLNAEQRAIYQQAQALGPGIDPLAVAVGGPSALQQARQQYGSLVSSPVAPAAPVGMGQQSSTLQLLERQLFEKGRGDTTLLPITTPLMTQPPQFTPAPTRGPGPTRPPALPTPSPPYTVPPPGITRGPFTTVPPASKRPEQFVPQTAFPTRGPELDIDYTPGTGDFLPTFAERAEFETPAFGPAGTIPPRVAGVSNVVGGYRETIAGAQDARQAERENIYSALETLSAPMPEQQRGDIARLGPTVNNYPTPTLTPRTTVAPIAGSQTPEMLQRLRASMAQGPNPELMATASQAAQRQAAASAAAATQGMGAVPTATPAPAPAGAATPQIITPEAYTSALPEGFDAAAPAPTMAPATAPAAPAPGQPAPVTALPGQAPTFEGSQQAQQMRDLLQQQLQGFAQAPTRFDTEAFQQMRAAQQGMLEREFGAQQQALTEELARRGLSSSSIAAGRFGDLAGQQALAQAQIDAQLLQEAARTQAEDRASLLSQMSQLAQTAGQQDLAQYEAQLAGQQQQFAQGLQSAELTGAFGGAQTLASQRLAEEQRQFNVQQQLQQTLGLGELEIGQRQLDLRAREIVQQAEQAGRSLNIEEARVQAQQEQFIANLEETRAQRLQDYGITQQELNQEAQRIQQAERGLSLEEARDQAEVGFRAQQLMQQDRTIGLEEARFVAGAELERDKYNAQREQFRQTLDEETRQFEQSLEEQRSQRLQNFNISQTELDQEAYRLQQADRTLDLQDARDRAEVGIRAQQLMQQDRSLDLQEARERAQEEIQIASLAEETAARLERNGLSRDDLNLRAEQVRYDAALRGEEIDVQKAIKEAEFQLQRERIASDYAMQGRDINSRETLAEIERETRKYIQDQTTNLSYAKINQDSADFDKEIEQRRVEATERTELLRFEMLFQLAQALGIEAQSEDLQKLLQELERQRATITSTPKAGT